jgi:signal transduction histidine kinase
LTQKPIPTEKFLKEVPLFAGLSDADLKAMEGMVEAVRLESGQVLFAEGDTGDRAYVIEEGQLEVFKTSEGRETLLAVRGSGDVIGEMALLENLPRNASVRARGSTRLLAVRKEQFEKLLETSQSAARVLFYTVLQRWRATEAVLRHSERMAQLGVLTAGVAHEMNNPAAAAKRGADQLATAMDELAPAAQDAAQLKLSDEQRQAMTRLEERARDLRKPVTQLNPIERSDRTSAVEDWLTGRGVEEPWNLSSTLVDWGYEAANLEQAVANFSAAQIPVVLKYAVAVGKVHALINEIAIGTGRISEIVKALKSYSYLDQAPVQDVDIREGIDNTLVILSNKLKSGIAVRREYAPDLPRIEAYGSELNQVWTNLIDNAADAMNGTGNLVIRARREGHGVDVEFEDDGPGIPPEIRPKVFDAFFTTKPPGKGTGLGLNVSYNIVVHRHRGSIGVTSKPGMTCFKVWLPMVLS